MNNKLLIIVDAQNDFIDGSLKNEDAINTIPNMVNYINNFEGPIICTFDTHDKNYLNTFEGKRLPIEHCILKTYGWQLNKDINNAVQKNTNFKSIDDLLNFTTILKDTFGSSQLGSIIGFIKNKLKIDEIIFMGFCTDICVINNVLITRTNFPDMKITVLKNCCAGTSKEAHEAALTVMKNCQIDIEQSDNLDSVAILTCPKCGGHRIIGSNPRRGVISGYHCLDCGYNWKRK